MKRMLRNVYLYIFGVPALLFLILMASKAPSDHINLVARILVSGLVMYVAGRYIFRAVFLVSQNNTTPESFNVVGWSTFLVAFILTTLYGAAFIAMGRPDWLASLYFNAAFMVLATVGAAMVAWSIPRVGIFPTEQKGLTNVALIFIGAGLMFIVSHLPSVLAMIKSAFYGLARAF